MIDVSGIASPRGCAEILKQSILDRSFEGDGGGDEGDQRELVTFTGSLLYSELRQSRNLHTHGGDGMEGLLLPKTHTFLPSLHQLIDIKWQLKSPSNREHVRWNKREGVAIECCI